MKAPLHRNGSPMRRAILGGRERAQRGLRGAEGRRAGLEVHGGQEVAEHRGRARALELPERHPGHDLGHRLRDRARHRYRTRRATENEGHDDRALVRAGVGPERPRHRAVVDERRVHVDVAHDHAVLVGEPLAEHDAGHLDGVLRPFRGGHRSHEGLVAVAQVRVDHVEVALVDRLVDRLAYGAPGVMQPGRRVRQLHEVLEVRERAVPPAVVHVVHEGGAVGRREDHVVLPDEHGAPGVAGVLGEAAGSRPCDDRLEEPRLESHTLAPDVGAGRAPQRQGVRIAAKLDADVAEDPIGGPIDPIQSFLAQQVIQGDPATYPGDSRRSGRGATLPAGASAGAAPGAGGRRGGGGPCHTGSVMPRWTLADPMCGMDEPPRESLPAPRRCCQPYRQPASRSNAGSGVSTSYVGEPPVW